MKAWILASLVAAAVGPALTLPASAQQVTAEQAVAYVDRDKDGKCSRDEYLLYHAARLDQFDTDKDGVLSLDEFRDSLQGESKKNAKRSFDAFNVEGNTKALTQREFLGYHAFVFKNYVDTDKDGFMSAAEWSKVMGLS